MAIENTFDFTIPDAEMRRLTTVGEMYAYIRDHAPGAAADPELWSRVVDLIERETGAPRKRIRPEASFVYDLGLG